MHGLAPARGDRLRACEEVLLFKGSKGRTLETLDLPKDGLVLSDHSQVPGEAQAKADPGVWCSWDLYKEQRPCLSLDLPALVIHM